MLIARRRLSGCLAAALLALASGAALAQTYPTHPIRLIVPFPPGGLNDTVARLLQPYLEKSLGQTVVVENRAAASGIVGTEAVAKAMPDGYALLMVASSHTVIPATTAKLPYDAERDFAPIAVVGQNPYLFVINGKLPAKTLGDFVALAKASPGKLTYASQGVGSTAHLSASQLEALAGIKMVHVPYRGAQPALTDLMAGQVDLFFDTPTTSVPLYRAKMLNILAVADAERIRALPEIPTFSEAGLPGFRSITWFGLAAPPGTPAAIADKINRDVVEGLRSPEIGSKLQALSLDVGATSRADAAKFFAEEAALWAKVIREAHIEAQ
jgi:tripartite-type tricarboxylate transporter receptor subunit TctC